MAPEPSPKVHVHALMPLPVVPEMPSDVTVPAVTLAGASNVKLGGGGVGLVGGVGNVGGCGVVGGFGANGVIVVVLTWLTPAVLALSVDVPVAVAMPRA